MKLSIREGGGSNITNECVILLKKKYKVIYIVSCGGRVALAIVETNSNLTNS